MVGPPAPYNMPGYRRLDIDVHFKPCPGDLQLIDQSRRVDFGYRRLYPAPIVLGGPMSIALLWVDLWQDMSDFYEIFTLYHS
jgi:hypothetical protein